MTPFLPGLDVVDRLCARVVDALSARRWAAGLFLVILAFATYLPGVIRLPAVDRTEIVYASAARDMLTQGGFIDPRYRGEQLKGKPIGAFWLEMGAVAALGEAARSNITAYRLPSLAGVILAVLATFWLLSPVLGTRSALVSAALLAVSPILAVLANLAVADGATLGAAVVAQLALMRIYLAASAGLQGEASPSSGVQDSPPPNLPREGGGTASSEPVAESPPKSDGTPIVSLDAVPPPSWGRLGGGEPSTLELNSLGLPLLFWTAQGVGILINALAVPLLSAATLIALFCFDRRTDWLRSLRPLVGVPLMLALGAPWLITRAIADGGVPFDGLGWDEVLAALGGSQNDRWKAAPGSFTLAFVLGFLPGAALLVPALWRLWLERGEALARFLLAWIAGGLLYLELVSGKPALYAVPPLFPAAAAAVVLAMTFGQPRTHPLVIPPRAFAPPWPIPTAFIVIVFGSLLWFAGAPPTPLIVFGALSVAALFALSAATARRKLAAAWVVTSIGGFAVFLAFTFGIFLPHLETAWPARRIAEAVAPLRSCAPGPIGIVGFREPSATFVLDADTVLAKPGQVADWVTSGEARVALVEARWRQDFARELLNRGTDEPTRVGCVEAFNVMRGCTLSFSIYLTGGKEGAPACRPTPAFTCPSARPPDSETPEDKARCR